MVLKSQASGAVLYKSYDTEPTIGLQECRRVCNQYCLKTERTITLNKRASIKHLEEYRMRHYMQTAIFGKETSSNSQKKKVCTFAFIIKAISIFFIYLYISCSLWISAIFQALQECFWSVFFLCISFHKGQYSLNTFEWTLDVGQETSLDSSGQEIPKNTYEPDFKPFKGF